MAGFWQLDRDVVLRAESFGGMAFHRRRGITLELDDEAYGFLCACRRPICVPASGHPAAHLIPQWVRLGFLGPAERRAHPASADGTFLDPPQPPATAAGGPAYLSAPEIVHVAITARCNQDCVGCYVPHTDGDELAPDEWRRLVDQWVSMRVFQMAVGGGEPLLYEGLFDLLAYVRDRGLIPNLTTNGTLLDAGTAERLAQSGVGQVNVSWNGPDGDAVQEHPAFERALRLLADASLRVGTNLLVTSALLDRLPQILAHLQGLGVRHVVLLRPKPPALPGGGGGVWYETHRLRGADVIRLRGVLRARRGALRIHVGSALVGLMSDVHPVQLRRRGVYGCAAGRRICTVWPDGQVTPCSFLADLCAGNAHDAPFDVLWARGQGWETLRDPAAVPGGRCVGCAIAAQCGGARCIARWGQGDLCAGDDECPAALDTLGSSNAAIPSSPTPSRLR